MAYIIYYIICPVVSGVTCQYQSGSNKEKRNLTRYFNTGSFMYKMGYTSIEEMKEQNKSLDPEKITARRVYGNLQG